MTDDRTPLRTSPQLPAGRTRIHFQAEINDISTCTGATPSLSVSIDYDPGDRQKALDLLQAIVDAARAETTTAS